MSLIAGIALAICILIFLVHSKAKEIYKKLSSNRSAKRFRNSEAGKLSVYRAYNTLKIDSGRSEKGISSGSRESLDWKTTKPLQLRPFKSQYNLKLSIEKAALFTMITIDQEFSKRIHLRRDIITRNPNSTVQASSAGKSAVDELYAFLVTEYLPTQYPSIFHFTNSPSTSSPVLLSTANGKVYELKPHIDPKETLKRLATLVDEDFMFLIPSSSASGGVDDISYTLQAYVICFSSGFSSADSGDEMIGKTLAELHAEVPGYAEHLGRKMERWVGRMKAGVGWRRCNVSVSPVLAFIRKKRDEWTITMNGKLRNDVGENQVYVGDAINSNAALDISQGHLRTEFQFMQRLPQSQAVVFSYKTYVYPLSEIKAEGNGPALADAIEGLQTGNSPEMYHYKGAGVWGQQVIDYLRN